MVIKKIKNRKYLILSLVIATVLLAGIGGFFWLNRANDSIQPTDGKEAADTFNKVDYAPADEIDKAYNDKIKENLGNGDGSPASQDASITVVDAAQYGSNFEVRAFINNLVENGGTCTLTFTGPGSKVEKIVSASADASTTRCENSVIPVSTFDQKGEWQLTVTYTSSAASGKTQPKTIEVR